MVNINATEPLTILKVHGRSGNLKINKSDIFTVLLMNSNVTQKIQSDRRCIVTFKCSEGDVKQKDELLCILSPCQHDIVIHDLCGLCSEPVEIKNFGNGEIKCSTGSRFAMLHSNKNVVVKREAAMEISMKDYVSLLKKRKLSLLVDLDATILHSTDKSVPRDMKDVFHYKMRAEGNSNISLDYHTKFRPYLRDFLTTMSTLYEMHIYTFGNKSYAQKIAEIIDPERRFFGQRIISKDDSLDLMKKAANLKSLFPIGDNMVCIIDDRTDVWNNAPNCIHVQPYMFFPETGDINDPSRLRVDIAPTESYSNVSTPKPVEKEPISAPETGNSTDMVPDSTETIAADNCETGNSDGNEAISTANASIEPANPETEQPAAEQDRMEQQPVTTEPQETATIDDPDRYLLSLARILGEIHRRFYEQIDTLCIDQSLPEIIEGGRLPDVKQLMTAMRSSVLSGCRVAFSGLIPLSQRAKDTYEFRMLTSLGAEYQHNISLPTLRSQAATEDSTDQEGYTTHLICKSEGTKKMKQVAHYITEINHLTRDKPHRLPKAIHRVNLVKHDWLWQSYFFWQKVDENDFSMIEKLKQLPIPEGHSEMKFIKVTKTPVSSPKIASVSRKRSLSPSNGPTSSEPKIARQDSSEASPPFVISEELLKELADIDDDSISGISTDGDDDSIGSYDDKDVPLDNMILHYSLQDQKEMFDEVDEAMDEEKCEKLSSPVSSDYYNTGSSSSSVSSDNESGDFQKPPKRWEQAEAASNESVSSDEKEMDYGDTDSNNDLECAKDDPKSDFDDVFGDCNF